jgi:hypothetical protein
LGQLDAMATRMLPTLWVTWAPKRRFALVIRTVGKTRATAKLPLVNLAYNFTRPA